MAAPGGEEATSVPAGEGTGLLSGLGDVCRVGGSDDRATL